ncbi:MAG: class I SAM-dependent methyltransferase [Acidimicrobiia bacterium]
MSSSPETFEIPLEAAEAYEERFVPAIFAEWAPHLVDAADVMTGQRVLDVACGTGIVARTAADRVGPGGRVVGVDRNEAMLTVAGRIRPDLTWRRADAAALPFDDGSFDAVLCQMALMFFPDDVAALREMGRVAATGGTVALVVPASLDAQPAYGPFVEMAARHAGPEAVSLLGTYWRCGDLATLSSSIEEAGLAVVAARTRRGTARFRSADALVATEVEGSPLADRIDDVVHQRIRDGAREVLAPFTDPSGSVAAPFVCHIVVAQPGPNVGEERAP